MADDRLPPLKREDFQSEDQKAAFDALEKEATATFGPPDKSPFVYKDSDGAFVGPFPFFLAAPEAGMHFLGLFRKLSAIPGLSPAARETAILAVGAHYEADYELYAHAEVARKTDLSDQQIEALRLGEKVEGLDEACMTTYDVAKELVKAPGRLQPALWNRCNRLFGKEGTVALVHYVGAYAYTCIVLNAMDCPVPEDDR